MQISLNIPQDLVASIALPASKSVSNRALLLQALCPVKRYAIANLAVCDDTDHMLQGVEAKRAGAQLIDIGATGTAMRFLTAFLAITEGETVITGSERMKQRPIGTLVEALRKLGADIDYTEKEGYPPLCIRGKRLQGGALEIEAGISSQYISALLMIAPCLADGLTLHLKGNIASRTYIELTLALMRKYGAVAEWTDEQTIRVDAGAYEDIPLTVEADWSAASYWYELAAIAGSLGHKVTLTLPALSLDSLQGDRVVAELFEPLGVKTGVAMDNGQFTIHKVCASERESSLLEFSQRAQPKLNSAAVNSQLTMLAQASEMQDHLRFLSERSQVSTKLIDNSQFTIDNGQLGKDNSQFEKDFTHCPDIAQTLAVTCCLLGIPYIFKGIHSLRIKETDRVAALITELRKLGFVLHAEGDERLVWDGERCEPDEHPVITTYDDHRMAMAFAPAALRYKNLTIEHPEVVTKSYPGFWEEIGKLQLTIDNSQLTVHNSQFTINN